MKKILIAAGGTGGHISPGIALAEELELNKKKYLLDAIYFYVPERNRNYPDFVNFPWKIVWHTTPQPNKNIFKVVFLYIYNIFNSYKTLKTMDIDVIIAMGGYSTIPAIIYGIIAKKEIFLCEQNTRIGKVNRLLIGFAAKTAFSFPLAEGERYPENYIIAGNPTRKKIIKKTKLKNKISKKINVLVMGGSQGARQINQMVLAAVMQREIEVNYNFKIISGQTLYDEVKNNIPIGKQVEVIPYSDDMGEHYSWANLIIARSGAGVLAEIALFGLPSILIPYPFAADNHQKTNAEYFLKNKAAWVLNTTSADDKEGLSAILGEIAEDKIIKVHGGTRSRQPRMAMASILKKMSVNALAISTPEAAKNTCDYFLA